MLDSCTKKAIPEIITPPVWVAYIRNVCPTWVFRRMSGRGTYPGLGSQVIAQLFYNVQALASACEMCPRRATRHWCAQDGFADRFAVVPCRTQRIRRSSGLYLGKRQIQALFRGAIEVFSRIASTLPLLLRTGFAEVCGELTRGYRHPHHLHRSGQQYQL